MRRSAYETDVREALRWWRANHPSRKVRPVHHGYFGHVLWTTDGEARVELTVTSLLDQWKAAASPIVPHHTFHHGRYHESAHAEGKGTK